MKCPKCNTPIPDDSTFCQFCGTDIQKFISQKAAKQQTKEAKSAQKPAGDLFSRHDDNRHPNNKQLLKRRVILIALTACLVISLAANAFLLITHNSTSQRYNSLNNRIESLTAERDKLKQKLDDCEFNSDNYLSICRIVGRDIGHGSKDFKLSRGLVVMNRGTERNVSLTTNYNRKCTITYEDVSSYSGCASIKFLDDEWYGSRTTLRINANDAGTSIFKFTNNVSTDYFYLVVIVV